MHPDEGDVLANTRPVRHGSLAAGPARCAVLRHRWLRGLLPAGSAAQCALLLLPVAMVSGAAACSSQAVGSPGQRVAAAPERRAIVISFDALYEAGLAGLPDSVAPTFRALFAQGTCAAWVRPAFPSLTAASHAALWTGTWGDENGIAANLQPKLPRAEHTLLDLVSGYLSAGARAEPIWVSAARAGVTVFAHHVTQAPAAPEYRRVRGRSDAAGLAALRGEAETALRWGGVSVLNGYNEIHARDTVLTEWTASPRAAAGWRHVERLEPSGREPLEIAWRNGPDSVFGLLHGERSYTHVTVAQERDVARGVTAAAVPADRSPVRGRALARHYSAEAAYALRGGGTGFLRVRLFSLAPDGSSFLLHQPGVPVVQANRPDVVARYDSVVRGWVRNGALDAYRRGLLGPTLFDGGGGEAEARYVETMELVMRQFMRGAALGWDSLGVRLLIDYLPILDESQHRFLGLMAEGVPGWDAERAEIARAAVARSWDIADARLADLRRRVTADGSAALFVTGDHGMRPVWRAFRPNVVLERAGLLERDASGAIDLGRTRALSPTGYWISVNTTDWKHGIVERADSAATVAAAEAALLAVRGSDGKRIVTRVWHASDHDSLGLGGAAGGDLYFQLAPGYRYSWESGDDVTVPLPPSGEHGFPSTDPLMRTALCVTGAAFGARRIDAAATIDIAPTVAAWLGMPAPRHARGRSLLEEMLAR